MRRQALALFLTVPLVGCVAVEPHPTEMGGCAGGACAGSHGRSMGPPTVPGVMDAYGNKVPMAAPYNSSPPPSAWHARIMMANSMPLSMMQMGGGMAPPGVTNQFGGTLPQTLMPAGGLLSPPGVPGAPGMPGPSGVMQTGFKPGMMPPGMMPPGMMPPGGPRTGLPGSPMMPFAPPGMGDSGVMQASMTTSGDAMQGVQQAQYSPTGVSAINPWGQRYASQRTQVKFNRPAGMKIFWFTQGPDGKPSYSTTPIETPGRWNFPQAAIYRLKLTNIEGRPELEVYPTMEVVPSSPRTEAFLSHSSVPVEFTAEDFKQIVDGNYVVKVIYLPDPQFQDVASTGTDEILSTRLEPGADPIQEARRRGSILLIIRMGNVHQELEHSPPLNAPTSGQPGQGTLGAQGVPAINPNMPIIPPGLSHGPGFGPDYPNRPLMQVPYYGLPGCPPGMMLPPAGSPGGMTNPQAPGQTPTQTPGQNPAPRMPPAQAFNPGAGQAPNYYLPPAGNVPPMGSLPPARSAETPPYSGTRQALPPTNLSPTAPKAPAPTSLSPNVSSAPLPPSAPPGGISTPPPSFAPPGAGSSSVTNTTPFLSGTAPRPVLKRPSIWADPSKQTWSDENKSSAPSGAPASSSDLPPTSIAPPAETGKTVQGTPVSTGSTPAPVDPIVTPSAKPGDIPLPPLQKNKVESTTPPAGQVSDAKTPMSSTTRTPGAADMPAPPGTSTTKSDTSMPPASLPSTGANAIPAFPSAPATPMPAPTTSQAPAPSGLLPASIRDINPESPNQLKQAR